MLKRHSSVLVAALFAALVSTLPGSRLAAADDKSSSAAEKQGKLIAVLQSEAPPAEKALACKQLAIYGSQAAVPALAPLLTNQGLSSWARIALEAIPDPSAAARVARGPGQVPGATVGGRDQFPRHAP